jgi:hypothetical protein
MLLIYHKNVEEYSLSIRLFCSNIVGTNLSKYDGGKKKTRASLDQVATSSHLIKIRGLP